MEEEEDKTKKESEKTKKESEKTEESEEGEEPEGIWKSAQTPKCLIVTKLKNENCAHCDQVEEA